MAIGGSSKPEQSKTGHAATAAGARKGSQKDQSIEGHVKQVIADQEAREKESGLPNLYNPEGEADIDAPLVRLVNSLLSEAVRLNASDIHIEPLEGMLRIRFRVDGVLQEVQRVPPKLAPPIVSRLKIMAELDICEKRMPQDGCIRFRAPGVEADLRMSTLPSVFGEKIVMRVLGKSNLNNDLSKLGIPPVQLKMLREAITKPDGLVLVTGPTGSGKTTTLYAALNELNEISVSVFTAEDPVEGTLPGVTQCQANPTIGYSFASILRSLLRQDPDVVLVGEIRDQETAEICIKAALTGHLVLSTLHTNCAVSTIYRLLDIGIAPYLITSSVNCIVAQRLVRRICDDCKTSRPLPPELLQSLGTAAVRLEGGAFAHGGGCAKCNNSGYRGRAPIYEIFRMSDDLRRLVLVGAQKAELKKLARAQGMITLREAGLDLVKQGITTLEEVLGVTNEDDEQQAQPIASIQAPLRQVVQQAHAAVVVPSEALASVHDQVSQPVAVPPEMATPSSLSASEGAPAGGQIVVDDKAKQAASKWKALKAARPSSPPGA